MNTSNRDIENKPTGLSRSDNPAVAADPPASSDVPLRGQTETNQTANRDQLDPGNETLGPAQRAAYDFGRRAALKHRRERSSPLEFESHEAQLEQLWAEERRPDERSLSWQEARESARDAWNKVQDAIAGQ